VGRALPRRGWFAFGFTSLHDVGTKQSLEFGQAEHASETRERAQGQLPFAALDL
jgi:hypothetical protein